MKNTLFALIAILCLCSCEDNAVSRGRTAYKEYFNKTLKDPSSIVIHSEEVIDIKETTATFVLDVGAKNSYGAMVRQTYTITTNGRSILKVSEYNTRSLPKNDSKDEQKLNFTYREKMIPITGFEPEKYIGKKYTLSDSCLYVYVPSKLSESIEAAKNRDRDKVLKNGGIFPSGTKVKIISVKDNTFEVEYVPGSKYYIEQSSIF